MSSQEFVELRSGDQVPIMGMSPSNDARAPSMPKLIDQSAFERSRENQLGVETSLL